MANTNPIVPDLTPDPVDDRVDVAPVEGFGTPDEGVDLRARLHPRFEDRREREMVAVRLADNAAAIEDRAEWESRLREWEDAYYGRAPDKTFPWPNCSNFWVPLTATGVDTLKPRLAEGVLGQDPPIILTATRQADQDRKDQTEQFLNWQVLTELKLQNTVAESAHLFLLPGVVIAKTWWRVDRIRRRYVREFPGATALQDVLQTLFGDVPPTDVARDPDGPVPASFTAKLPGAWESGGPLEVRIQINPLTDDMGQITTQVFVEREELVERPQVDLVDPPDFYVPIKGGAEVDALPWCQQAIWMDEAELRRRARLGQFSADAVEKLLTSSMPRGDSPPTDAQSYRDAKDDAEGVEGDGATNVRHDQWRILEDYRREDVDEDGHEAEVVTWVCADLPDTLLGWTYLDDLYAHGRRPYRVGRYDPVPFRFYPRSFAEVIKAIQDEINTIHNQRVDYATIQNLPFFFYKSNSALPAISIKLRPGDGVPMENPQQDIVFPKFQGSPVWGQQEEMMLMQQFERLTGLTDMTLGRQPNRVGATRTAAGTQTLIQESNLRYQAALQAFQRFWCGIFQDILALDQEYLPPAKEYRVTGKSPGVIRMRDRMDIRGQFDLRVSPTTDTLNRQQMRNDSTQLLQMAMNPALIQTGVIGRKGIRRAVEDVFKTFSRDPEHYMDPEQLPLAPEEELAMMVRGEPVAPSPAENIQYHLMVHQQAFEDPALPPATRAVLTRHIQETMMMAQQLMMAQGMQAEGAPPMGQQATNAAIGAAPQPGPAAAATPPPTP